MKFIDFHLVEELQKGIDSASYVNCTEVQEKVLNSSLEGQDLYVQSQTGTGKTAAFLIPVIEQILTRPELTGKQALIMVPTRELAVQVQEEAEKLCKFTKLVVGSFFGGVGYDKQISLIKSGVDILIGTPGRLIDLQKVNQLDLSKIAFLVIDEADRMFDMGFYPDLRELIKVLPISEKRQTMLFSATLNSYVKNLAWEYTKNPIEISVEDKNMTVEEIDQELIHISSDKKMSLLLGVINKENPESLIIFANTKKNCEIISKRLSLNNIKSEYIIGDLPQMKRLAIMNNFKSGKIKCLVATDVAARGIDVNDLSMVINYDLPTEAENYVHRIGRTARAGKSGKAYTFCSEQDVYSLPSIERYIEKAIPSSVADESLFIEDKSKNVYIQLERDKSSAKSKKSNSNSNNYYKKKDSKNKGVGKYSSKNSNKRNDYKRDRRVFSQEEENKLSSMTTDERMAFYKNKYAKQYNISSVESSTKKMSQKNNVKIDSSNEKSKSKKTEKKNILIKLKSIFGGKK